MKPQIEDHFFIFSNIEFCISEIDNIRKQFNTLSKDNYQNLVKGIGLIALFCPEELKMIVLSLFDELRVRYNLILMKDK